jgi:hypothetical protein
MTLVLVEAEKNIKNVVELFKKMERLLHFFHIGIVVNSIVQIW